MIKNWLETLKNIVILVLVVILICFTCKYQSLSKKSENTNLRNLKEEEFERLSKEHTKLKNKYNGELEELNKLKNEKEETDRKCTENAWLVEKKNELFKENWDLSEKIRELEGKLEAEKILIQGKKNQIELLESISEESDEKQKERVRGLLDTIKTLRMCEKVKTSENLVKENEKLKEQIWRLEEQIKSLEADLTESRKICNRLSWDKFSGEELKTESIDTEK